MYFLRSYFFILRGSAKKKCYDLPVVLVCFYVEWVNSELLTKAEIYDENSNKLEFCVNQPSQFNSNVSKKNSK